MNFDVFCLFLIFIEFSPSTGEIFFHLNETSLPQSHGEEASRRISQENRRRVTEIRTFPNGLTKVASHTTTVAESLRRLLKNMRKWCRSHPVEVKLGKCFARYFNIKIPGLRRYEQLDDFKVQQSKQRKFLWKTTRNSSPFKGDWYLDYESQKSFNIALNNENFHRSFENIFPYTVWSFFDGVVNNIKHYHDLYFKNEMVICLWDYLEKKFWGWVDSAPDS